ncbi:MAG: alanine--tRNA ligase [Candidatus Acidiferrales bacterium]
MTGNEIRETFLKFFEAKGHRRVRSSSLVPANDPTLLFTNAGMNQFKDVFLGLEQREYKRATTCQKCVRAGGKHNDLENVGFTNRHHTFFEMLGNFSFGDYFKKDAIAFAWELVTSPKWFGIPKEKLYVTVFGGAEVGPDQILGSDRESAVFWGAYPELTNRVVEVPGLKENFWSMGDTGPCGPCTEIFYDMGPAASDEGHLDCTFPCDCGRYVEIWNLVFMQFNRDAGGKLNPLPKPSVDTGAGLERLAAVLQGKISNFDTDLFRPLMNVVRFKGKVSMGDPDSSASLRILADHARAATFLITDGVMPSNDGRGYVLRKIIRRALLHAKKLSSSWTQLIPTWKHVFPDMAFAVRDVMKDAYPELLESSPRVRQILLNEEARFDRTVNVGLEKFEALAADFRAKMAAHQEAVGPLPRSGWAPLSGRDVFKLYDTYGLPRDFIEDVARDSGLQVDWDQYNQAMLEQRERARASWKGAHKESANPVYTKLAETFKTEPDFYQGTATRDARIEAIVTKNGLVNELPAGAEGEVVLDRTTIYAESGGQVADTGSFFDNAQSLEIAQVKSAYYPVSGLIAHRVVAKENLRPGDRVATIADPVRRARDKRNHTATHLMHAALRNILGTHVKQAGSLVAPDHLRFDFSHFAAVDPGELTEIEQQVNEEIRRNYEIQTDIMNIDEALASGALAFFGDKYPEANVRVVTIPDAEYPRGFYSKELCGGTHVTRSGEIGMFKIVAEQSVAAGVRRVEAISGDRAVAEYVKALDTLRKVAGALNAGQDEVLAVVERQSQTIRQLEKQLEALKRKSAGSMVDSLLEGARKVKDVNLLASAVSGVDRDALRQLVDSLRQKMGSGVVVLGTADDGKVALITGVTKDLTSRVHAGKLIQELAKKVGGSGGGRPDLAEAGGKDTSALESAMSEVPALLERMLQSDP